MKTSILGFGLAAFVLLCSSCQKKEAPAAPKAAPVLAQSTGIELVAEQERSSHFAVVNKHLDLGGTLYGYVDIDGDALKLASELQDLADRLAEQQPAFSSYLKQDFGQLVRLLGLNDLKALGFSSVPEAGGSFRNRAFFYMPEGRHGLLAGLGGPAAPVANARFAPVDTDFFAEGEMDLPVVYATIRALVAKVGGEASANMMDAKLKEVGAKAGLSAYDCIQGIKGRSAVVLRLDAERTIDLPSPQPIRIPALSLLLRIDGIAPALKGALEKLPVFEVSMQGSQQHFVMKQALPVGDLKPVIVIEGKTLWVATTPAFFAECQQPKGSLEQNAEYNRMLTMLGKEGNAVSYASSHFFARLRQLEDLNPQANAQVKQVLKAIVKQVPQGNRPHMTVRINMPDGILVRASWSRSFKKELAMASVYNPVTVGLLAAMAIPAFEKVRSSSQEKAIMNNLRQLAAAADQYYLENNVDSTTYDKLVGTGKYIKKITPVAGENYRSLIFKQGKPLRVRTKAGKVITYEP